MGKMHCMTGPEETLIQAKNVYGMQTLNALMGNPANYCTTYKECPSLISFVARSLAISGPSTSCCNYLVTPRMLISLRKEQGFYIKQRRS